MNGRVNEYIRAWVEKANNDLKNAELVLAARDENCPYDTVCFHCQQAVEKYLKAFLVHQDISFPRSHNLSDLVVTRFSVKRKLQPKRCHAGMTRSTFFKRLFFNRVVIIGNSIYVL